MDELPQGAAPKPSVWARRRVWLKRILWATGIMALLAVVLGGGGTIYVLMRYGQDLPDFKQLADYEPPVITRIHAGDGSLLKEYAREKRLFVPLYAIPPHLVDAFLAAEDKNFYSHPGVDFLGIVRAALTNSLNVFTDRRPVGASTITQQVAKNFLLTRAVSYERKIKEAILAFRIERAFTKDEILELYMNDSYLGHGAYGVAAGALIYFDKPLDELSIGEAAYLAAVLKFPSNNDAARRLQRRNWTLSRMADLDFITAEQEAEERAAPVELKERQFASSVFRADYFVEEIRRDLYRIYGGRNLYEGGFSVRTTLDPRLQAIAEKALRDGLVTYDRRHGWRGSITRISLVEDTPVKDAPAEGDESTLGENAEEYSWASQLGEIKAPLGIDAWQLAVVLELQEAGAVIGFEGGGLGYIPLAEITWARQWREGETLGPKIKDAGQVLGLGAVIPVEWLGGPAEIELPAFVDENGETLGPVPAFGLRQIPDVEGAIVAMDPHTGRVLAMVGGYDFSTSEFNRATQAERQPGSAFKPFVYASALGQGFTPSSLVLDAPFVMDQGEGQGKWKPGNSTSKFYGPSTLRLGLVRSRNLMTVRLAQYIGMEAVIDTADRFGIGKNLRPTLAMSLGAGEVSLLKLTAAYAMLVNGGNWIDPGLIDRIQDRRGKTIYKLDERPCGGCNSLPQMVDSQGLLISSARASEDANAAERAPEEMMPIPPEPVIPDQRKRVLDERTAYQVVSMLQGVVQSGTGRRIGTLGWPLGGKTGTTNDWFDAWFIGFSPDLAVGVFVGFDRPRSLGKREEGSLAAAPIFRDFMAAALKGKPHIPFRIPPGIRLVRVDPATGLPAGANSDGRVILEAFIPGTEPSGDMLLVLDGANGFKQTDGKLRKGTGGLY